LSEKLQQSLRKKNTLLHQKLKSAQRQKQGKEWQLFNFKLHVLISETLAARGSIWKFE
jgi:hypothetical protein